LLEPYNKPVNRKIQRELRKLRHKIRQWAFHIFVHLKYNIWVWGLINRHAVASFETHRPKLNKVQESILAGLQTDGIAITNLEELFDEKGILMELQTYVAKRSDRIRTNHKKPFLEDLISEIPELGIEIPFFKVAIDNRILDIVNSYLGMHSRLTHFMLRQTKIMNGELPSHSQNWHRAPQERKNCRVYIYLNDVDAGSGPFSYIPQSTSDKKYGHVMPQTARTRGYITAEIIEQSIPKNDQLTVTGKAGTVIFCDSTGLHRGGYSTNKSRIMSTFGYSAPSFRENIHYSYTRKLKDEIAGLSPANQWVLQPRWQRDQM